MQVISTPLDSGWEVAERLAPGRDLFLLQGGEKLWVPATVPGHVHTDLTRAGIIADPFQRLGEWGARWVDETDWTYRTTFTVTAERLASREVHGRHFLQFQGIDTIGRIFLNGKYLGQTENYHLPYRFDVTDHLKDGANELKIELDSALRVGRERAAAYLGDGTSERGRMTYFNFAPRAFVRKPQYMFGWDWGPEIVSCGLHGAVELVTVPVAEILQWRMDYNFIDDTHVAARFRVTLRKYDSEPITVMAALFSRGDTTPSTTLEGGPGEYTVTLTVDSLQTEHWWPNGQGESRKRHLLNLRLLSVDDAAEVIHGVVASVGFRTVELVREPDADGHGEGFRFRVNGADLYIKGANWIPDHNLPTTITEPQLRARLTAARDAGFNMLRVWGGGLYESETFYDLCDELGILVWQDFGFACSMYPDDDPAFVASVRAEAIAQVRRLRHRPSLALWCGGNENLELHQGRWSGADQATKFFGDRLIHETLPDVLAAEDTVTPYWPNSPYGGPHSQSEDFGDAHYWNVWHSKEPGSNGDWTNYTKCRTRFSSEFGFAAPATATAWNQALAPEERTVHSLESQWHDKTRKGYETYLGFIALHFPEPQTFDDLIYYGQCNQALALQYGVEHWRRLKGRCWGTLFWQFNDCWPTHSWAVHDSAGEPKLAYFAAKRFYAPLLLSLHRAGRGVEAHLVNDLPEQRAGHLSLRLLTFGGEPLSQTEKDAFALPNAASGPIATLEIPSFVVDSGPELLVHATFTAADGTLLAENFLLLAEPKELRLPDPGLRLSLAGESITLTAERFAAFVVLSFEGLATPPLLSDNGFHLAPGQSRTITLSRLPAGMSPAAVAARLRVRTL